MYAVRLLPVSAFCSKLSARVVGLYSSVQSSAVRREVATRPSRSARLCAIPTNQHRRLAVARIPEKGREVDALKSPAGSAQAAGFARFGAFRYPRVWDAAKTAQAAVLG